MATAAEHGALYGELRAQVLARFFAYGRYFRANHLALANTLGSVRNSASVPDTDPEQANRDSGAVTCENRSMVRPTPYADAAGLLGQDPAVQEVERWRVADHDRENPLLYGSQLLVALTVEHLFGRKDALPIIRLALKAIGSLYKFEGNHFDGYPIRWDPVTSDRWATQDQAGRQEPLYCCEFLRAGGAYLYSTPFNHPAYVPYNPVAHPDANPSHNDDDPDRLQSLRLHRHWEASQDELVGVVLTYDFVYHHIDDTQLRREIRRQVTNLGDYLAEHGYLLVRPSGGFSARGASGVLPALEYPFGRVFERITGNPYPSRASFERAMELAGVWPCMEERVTITSIGGSAVGAVVGLIFGPIFGTASGSPVASAFGTVLGGVLGGISGWFAGRALGVHLSQDCFDVEDENMRLEFASAYLLKLLPPKLRFTLWIENAHRGKDAFSRNFPPFLGLTALADPDRTVRDGFFSSHRNERAVEEKGRKGHTGFASAVAAVLGAVEQESSLREWLDDAHANFDSASRNRLLTLKNTKLPSGFVAEQVREGTPPNGEPESPMGALEYLACLALSWLRVREFEQSGSYPAGGALVRPPNDLSTWPSPVVPAAVIASGVVPALPQYGTDPEIPSYIPLSHALFPADDEAEVPPETTKSETPPPSVPAPVVTNEYTVLVRESDAEINTQVPVYTDDRVTITARGTIWAGVWLTGRNGPGGWDTIDHNKKFPLPGSHPFCLLYKLVPTGQSAGNVSWKRLGPHSGEPPQSVLSFDWPGGATTLYLRTNDDKPGNGDGYFTCSVKVERPPH